MILDQELNGAELALRLRDYLADRIENRSDGRGGARHGQATGGRGAHCR